MSQFDALFKPTAKEKTATEPKVRQKKMKTIASLSPTAITLPEVVTEKRPAGKSSRADYTQVLTYVRRDTHNRVKAALIFDERRRDLSDLVEELLSDWLEKNK